MDLKQLKAFLTVADTGNVTKAAEMLHLVQPAVSRQLRLLEEDLGQILFERERHGMALTEAGKSLVGYARRVMLELDRARTEMTGRTGNITGLVTIGLLPSTIDVLASSVVSTIAARYPGIRLRIAMGYAGTLLSWLDNGEIDAGLLYGVERSVNVESRPLIEEALWVIGQADAGLRPNRPTPLAKLSRHPLVLPSPSHGIRTIVDHACAKNKVQLNISVEVNALSVQRSLVHGGHGWTILPPIAVAEDLRSGQLTGSPLSKPNLARTIVLALPTNRETPPYVRHAISTLEECTKQAVMSGAWPQARWLGK
ncbi:LysR family transcriptional regulator [Verminephrobacter aporrectodeae subsp. tuberculatae]|uniref:LysR family transcriptional regulator n=1 Tax=Verminephrobacter aporrectodeae subsp. tuberculatae TaxID=1110392 RepID=A0ABT3KQS6_9BURK|nr:LysR substrate-binding domain-containing protein [Verminephrobacter aporrectodeae]MCW5220442.1 LysR family transcriptional regulator [Verminephrobacter aporrectodeae subsp. tuberculatae]MCW5255603.1 LysR family transcriptional regulator [Verminephrobacter aporrectodeae subsp. tuberculatae]MCW5289738.1 LysR family transcriptional regulator [Verminephrobacter aporrectodeae subsp. tuberculatae]MCW5320620.1 LysR family transcriptional regulator [Verminephrobacter aporrectodeae subsp. tuberculata